MYDGNDLTKLYESFCRYIYVQRNTTEIIAARYRNFPAEGLNTSVICMSLTYIERKHSTRKYAYYWNQLQTILLDNGDNDGCCS